MLRVNEHIVIDESELQESFIRAAGPGGQNVNKVSTAVELRFDMRNSPALPEAVRQKLMVLAGRRVNREGVLVLTVQTHRSQDLNRQAARERLAELIRRAAEREKPRRPTRPGAGARKRRLKAKSERSEIKAMRRSVDRD